MPHMEYFMFLALLFSFYSFYSNKAGTGTDAVPVKGLESSWQPAGKLPAVNVAR